MFYSLITKSVFLNLDGFNSYYSVNCESGMKCVVIKFVSVLLFLGERSKEAFEAFKRTESMDVGQVGWCLRATSIHWSPQTP